MNAAMYDVSNNVTENVKVYLADYLPNYELVQVYRKSVHPADDYLYMVIAKREVAPEYKAMGMNEYAFWTSWNETTQSLNHGHYNIESEEIAREMIAEYFYDYD